MSPAQLDLIPDLLLFEARTNRLREWLRARGWHMTLAELEGERARRKRSQ